MKFAFPIKHNGVLYDAGKDVPIGKEAKKDNEINDKTATEIKEILKTTYGVKKFPGGLSKVKLVEMLKEEEAKSAESQKSDIFIEEANVKKDDLPNDITIDENGNAVPEDDDKTFLEKVLEE